MMGMGVKILGLIDIIAAVVLLLGNNWIGINIIAVALLLKGVISLVS